ncbi:hypothetical protein ACVXZZ_11575 [Staphylococcus aureus]
MYKVKIALLVGCWLKIFEIENHYVGPTPPDQDHQYELTVYAFRSFFKFEEWVLLNEFLKEVNQHKIDQTSINLIGRKIRCKNCHWILNCSIKSTKKQRF